ncbi:MAG: hypothetical protein GTO12_04345 [Proteobacteria bacterium]|nr:hypothetical protein [Pseudomonadota bacterium]
MVDSLQWAVEMQQVLSVKNDELPEKPEDGVPDRDQPWGCNRGVGPNLRGGVNFAARFEGLAGGGGICISRSACEQIENRLPLMRYEHLGEHAVKNVIKPIRV